MVFEYDRIFMALAKQKNDVALTCKTESLSDGSRSVRNKEKIFTIILTCLS